MKNYFYISVVLTVILFSLIAGSRTNGQPEPPRLPDLHGHNGNSSPQGAPLGDGSEVLLLLGFAYGSTKFLNHRKKPV